MSVLDHIENHAKKDKDLTVTTAVSGSGATYTTAIDLGTDKQMVSENLEIVVTLTLTTGTFVFSLIGDTDSTMDGSSVVAYTLPSKTGNGTVATFRVPIPSDFNYRYVGLSLSAVAHAGSVEHFVQDRRMLG